MMGAECIPLWQYDPALLIRAYTRKGRASNSVYRVNDLQATI